MSDREFAERVRKDKNGEVTSASTFPSHPNPQTDWDERPLTELTCVHCGIKEMNDGTTGGMCMVCRRKWYRGQGKICCDHCGDEANPKYHGCCDRCFLARVNRLKDAVEGTESPAFDLGHHDVGNRDRLVVRHGEKFRYTELGWLVWDKTHWSKDKLGRIHEAAIDTAKSIAAEVVKVRGNTKEDEEIRESIEKWCKASQMRDRLNAMVAKAESHDGIATSIETFDTDINVFNCASGTMDLTTFILKPHDPNDLLTNYTPVAYVPNALCERWKRFILEIMDGNQEMADFLQRAVGYTLTGLTVEHVMFILWGSGSNGKSTFIETLRYVLGIYSKSARFSTFVASKWGESKAANNDVAAMRGKRFVSAAEGEAGAKFAEAVVKESTGGDTISARFLYKEYFDYKPQFKLWLSTQHKPEIVGVDDGIWRRIRLVPFNVKFEKDITLSGTLLAEAEGILAWAVEGLKQWRLHGLMEPETVINATTEYRAEEDTLMRFIQSDRLELDKAHRCGARELWQEYKKWCKDNHIDDLSEWKFSDAMKMHGYTKLPRSNKGIQYAGIRIANQCTEDTMQDFEQAWGG
jgi:putative DNA primase/helicase